MALLSVYAPTEDSNGEETEQFYSIYQISVINYQSMMH
jgi:hypothetical protein